MSDIKPLEFSDLQREAHAIARQYKADGYDMTVRQLFYQLVARGMIPNTPQSYKRVGSACVKARLAGWFGMDLLVDRGRTVGLGSHTDYDVDVDYGEERAKSYINSIPGWCISADRWFAQPKHVSVWVEKEALAGVFEGPCSSRGVGMFACKGYPSLSALWQWLEGLEMAHQAAEGEAHDLPEGVLAEEVAEEAVVLYFGDHDPDGWQIPRSAENTIRGLLAAHPLDVPPIRFKRVALNMDQIQQYTPPPFMAKMSSSRYQGYIDEHGTTDAWELDALTPDTLESLIGSEIDQLFDDDVYSLVSDRVRTRRAALRSRMKGDGWMDGVL